MRTYIYIYMYTHISISLSLSIYIYIYRPDVQPRLVGELPNVPGIGRCGLR